jgi:hypothetical protein
VAVFIQSSVHKPLWRRLFSLPQTGPGWLSVVLAAVFVVLFSLDVAVFLPSPEVEPWLKTFFGIVLLVYGLASGVEALYALIRCHERSVLSWLCYGTWAISHLLGDRRVCGSRRPRPLARLVSYAAFS